MIHSFILDDWFLQRQKRKQDHSEHAVIQWIEEYTYLLGMELKLYMIHLCELSGTFGWFVMVKAVCDIHDLDSDGVTIAFDNDNVGQSISMSMSMWEKVWIKEKHLLWTWIWKATLTLETVWHRWYRTYWYRLIDSFDSIRHKPCNRRELLATLYVDLFSVCSLIDVFDKFVEKRLSCCPTDNLLVADRHK